MTPRKDDHLCPCGKLRSKKDAKHESWCPERTIDKPKKK